MEPEREEVVEEEIFSLQSSADIRDLTQQDGWKTQDGRMTKKGRARPGMHISCDNFLSFCHLVA